MAIFQSYGGGAHGASPVVLNTTKPSMLGEIGSFLNQMGQIPAEMQQAMLKKQLNDLLLKSLSTPQTMQKQVQGPDQLVPKEGTTIEPLGDQSLVGMMPATEQSIGDLFSQQPGAMTTKDVANPEFTDVMSRLEKVGPAFGMKFPTPIENIYAASLAKSLGAGQLETQKQEGREKIEGIRTTGREALEHTKGEERRLTEADRQVNRVDIVKRNIESKEKIAANHEANIQNIATAKNLNDQEKIDKILKERTNFHEGVLTNYGKKINEMRRAADSLDEIRQIQQINGYKDDLTKQLTQIDKIIGKGASHEVEGELKSAVSNYNDIVDKVLQLDPDSTLVKIQDLDRDTWKNNLRSLFGQPQEKTIGTVPATPRSTTPKTRATETPAITTPNSNTKGTYLPSEITPEELKRRRDNIFNRK
jgi:hypothetical protein